MKERRREANRAVALVLAVLLGGLPATGASAFELGDLWPFGKKDEPAEQPVPDPFPYTTEFTVAGGDEDLREALEGASTLLDRQDSPPSGLTGLVARANEERSTLVAVLYENAYYAGQIEIAIAGRPLDGFDPFDELAAPVAVSVTVRPGAAYSFGRIEVSSVPDGFDLAATGLVEGEPAGSAVILEAETAIAGAWRERGHPLVAVGAREVVADHRTARLDVVVRVAPGPVADFGRVTVEGAVDVDTDLIVGRANLGNGRYAPMVVDRATKRLRELNVFGSVRIVPGDALDPDGTIPMTIIVTERKKRVIGASAAYSSTEGIEAEAYWMHRNLFGGAERLRLSFGVSRIGENAFDEPDLRAAVQFRKPGVFDPLTDLILAAEAELETTDAYRKEAVSGSAGLSHIFSDTLTGGVTLEVERSRTRDAFVTQNHLLTGVAGSLDWDRRNDPLDPSEGFRVRASGGPTYDFIQDTAFASARVDASTYRALGDDDKMVLAVRGAAEVLFADSVLAVAADRRLYAGGGGSVRGYAYRNIGPRDPFGDLIGGRSLLEGSGELRYRVNERYGLVAFVDAATVGMDMVPGFEEVKVGVGGGVRYATPIGPLRVDVAVPLAPEKDDPSFGIYVGLGQAF